MATPFNLVSVDAQTALTEFSTEFDTVLSAAEPDELWSRSLGLYNMSRAIRTTYPIPVSAAGYVLREGDDKMRDLYQKSASVTPSQWQDGVTALSTVVEAPDFVGWATEPRRMATEANRHPNSQIAGMLEANPTCEFDGKALFADDHPVNVFDTSAGDFDNDHAVTVTTAQQAVAMIAAMKQRFRERVAPNGKPMGLRLTDLVVPPALEELFRDALENDLLINVIENQAGTENVAAAAGNNRHKGTVNLIVADELTSADYVYGFDRNGPPAWVYQDGGTPEEVRYDKDSDYWKDTGKIGIKYILLSGYAPLLAHAIERVDVS